jgi:TDG/mug DNA glycosylase family protein
LSGRLPAAPRAGVLPDLLRPGLRLVFCGMAAGHASALRGAYYAGPGNRFWPMLAAAGLTPRRFRPEEFPALLELGIGLTDIAKTASGPDRAIPRRAEDALELRAKIEAHAPAVLAFNGKCAAGRFFGGRVAYGWQSEVIGATRLFVLPSSSGAARGFWDEAPWRELAAAAGRSPV